MIPGFVSTSVIEDVHRPVVIAPTFNNATTLPQVLAAIHSLGLPIIVINDGSTDNTSQILSDFQRRCGIRLVIHPQNQGKAAALQTGFCTAEELGFTHALTIDTDGQHNPADVPQLLQTARENPRAIVLGTRDLQTAGYPYLSRAGRYLSNLLIRAQSGATIYDSQCGLRVYPLAQIRNIPCRAPRYGLETEILTRASWAKVSIVQVPVSCQYFPPAERVTHFRPVADTLSAVAMHTRLLPRAVASWLPGLGHWLSPVRAIHEIRNNQSGRSRFAAGLAIGVFIACLPIYGIQSVLSLVAARRLKLHPLSVLAGSHLSIPPISPILIAASLAIGHLLLHGQWPRLDSWNAAKNASFSLSLVRSFIYEWVVGGLTLGIVLALLTYPLAYMMLRFTKRRTISSQAVPITS